MLDRPPKPLSAKPFPRPLKIIPSAVKIILITWYHMRPDFASVWRCKQETSAAFHSLSLIKKKNMKHQVRWSIFRKPNPKLCMLWTPSISSKSLRYALGFTTSSRIRWSNTEGPDWSHHGCATWISPSSKGASSQGGLGSVMICLNMDVKILQNCYSKIFRKNEAKSWDSHWHCSKELSSPASKAATPSAAEMQPAPWTAGSLDLLSCRTQTGSSAKSKEFRGSQIWQSDDVLFQVLFCTDWRDCVCISQGDRMENKVCSFQLGFKAEKGVQDCIPGQN